MTRGLLYDRIDTELWRRLDEFEGDFYQRITVDVACEGSPVTTQVYVVKPSHRAALSARLWSADIFRARHLAGYLERYT